MYVCVHFKGPASSFDGDIVWYPDKVSPDKMSLDKMSLDTMSPSGNRTKFDLFRLLHISIFFLVKLANNTTIIMALPLWPCHLSCQSRALCPSGGVHHIVIAIMITASI